MSDQRPFANRSAAMEASDDEPLSPPEAETIGDVIAKRYGRRDIMKGALGVTAATALFGPAALAAPKVQYEPGPGPFRFKEVKAGADTNHHVADGYNETFLLRWGDPLHEGLAAFDPYDQSADQQKKRFGYNNDYIAYFPVDGSKRGLLCINHEYTNEELMFPEDDGPPTEKRDCRSPHNDKGYAMDEESRVAIEMEAVGVTVVEVFRDADNDWHVDKSSSRNRRIAAHEPMRIDGPARGHVRLQTKDDASGERVLGTFANCAGGQTPWGTYLTAEENIHFYFSTKNEDCNDDAILEGQSEQNQRSFPRYRIPSALNNWGKYHTRFNIDEEPNEPNRFGWIVEIDPADKNAVPVKHTALGRFFHEGAECVLNEKDNRVVVFSGDDAVNEYVYRFVSKERFVDGDTAHNRTLLSEGTLSVAKFFDNGTGAWIPLVYGEGKLSKACAEGKFQSQADIVIDARLAADEVGATAMDRPEDVQPNKKTGRVYVMLTNNVQRSGATVDNANPRANNRFGHIIEMIPEGGDFAAETFAWDILVRCGDPDITELGAYWNAATTKNSWFVSPDNATIDPEGRLWIATDQGRHWQQTGRADGLFALETDGVRRGTPRMFFRVPLGGEMAGPCFTPDGQALFLSVQHPGADGVEGYAGIAGPSTFECPATRWPDFQDDMPPRPTVMVITKGTGDPIG